MTQAPRFQAVLESVEALSVEEQEVLIDLVRRRLVERRRSEIAANIAKAQEETEKERDRRLGNTIQVLGFGHYNFFAGSQRQERQSGKSKRGRKAPPTNKQKSCGVGILPAPSL